jgi:hypothetical protein
MNTNTKQPSASTRLKVGRVVVTNDAGYGVVVRFGRNTERRRTFDGSRPVWVRLDSGRTFRYAESLLTPANGP